MPGGGEDLFAKRVVLEEGPRATLAHVCDQWEGGKLAWQVIEYVLSHDELAGRLLIDSANLRAFEYSGARSINQPDLYVIYEVLEYEIVVKVIGYDEAQASSAGQA